MDGARALAALALGGMLVAMPVWPDPRVVTESALPLVVRALVAVDSPPPRVDAVAVHGGGGTAAERERAALALVRAGVTDTIVALGGRLPRGDPDMTYAGAVLRRLNEIGAEPATIVRLDRGLSTGGELAALRELAEERGWRSLALATSSWHTRRVRLLAERTFAGSPIAWYVVAAGLGDVREDDWWRMPDSPRAILAEWAKIAALVSPAG
jgi:uncharacterized SAM-binding protein YcdF (DUF218 family)